VNKVTKRGSDPNVMEIKEKHRERRVRRLKSGGNGHVPPTPPLSSHASPDSQEARIEMQPRGTGIACGRAKYQMRYQHPQIQ